jgi:hypothetical protein
MTLYSKNGSIPKDHTDGTDGWVEVPEPPLPGPGEETVWWCPPGWVVRPVEPEPVEGYVWKWSQSEEKWVDYPIPTDPPAPTPPPPSPNGTITTTEPLFSGNVTLGGSKG